MRFGLFAINFNTCADPEVAVRVALAAEAAGFDSVWTGEHVVLPDPRTPQSPLPPGAPMLDTVVAASWIAAHTSTIRIGTGIIVLPLRNPVVLAKELASLDVVSKGRLIVGVAAGYLAEEFAAVGVPLAERGRRIDDSIAAMRALWEMDSPRHDGAFVSFSGVDAHPRPVQRPLPIFVGGGTEATVRRAVTTAHGFYGFAMTTRLMEEWAEAFRRAHEEHERPAELGRLQIYVTPVDGHDPATIDRYEELGVDCIVALPTAADRERRHLPVPEADILRTIDELATGAGRSR
jgi:probable F420-dependent oxidoreductase